MEFFISGRRAGLQKIPMITNPGNRHDLKLFLCGDVMTGRGIDQALPHQADPVLYESWIEDARDYLRLAEQKNGPIETPVSREYIWGDAQEAWKDNAPDLKLANLETSITTNEEPWPGKGINYRMHPDNVKVLSAAGIDHCSLANNHILDWGHNGLKETIKTLESAKIKFSGAGYNMKEASAPSVFHVGSHRALVYSCGSIDSGIAPMWAAGRSRPGVNFFGGYGKKEIAKIRCSVESDKNPGDMAIFSVHWGGNWGYPIPEKRRRFAYNLIDEAGIDVIFGHSSHHPLGIEVYKQKPVIYGAGDFINDYEGISGHEEYRGELSLMYFPVIEIPSGNLISLKMVPMEIKKFRLNRAPENDAQWLRQMLDREGDKLGTGIRMDKDSSLWLEW